MDRLTKELTSQALRTARARLSGDAMRAAQTRVLDTIACAFAAYDNELCGRMRRILASPSITHGARIWGAGSRITVEDAALVNGTMARYLDLNDTILGRTSGHPSDTIPALLALAEEQGASGEALLRAIVISYDLYCGLCDGVALAEKGVDQVIAAALGAAGGSACLLGLDEARTEHALALAVAANVGLFNVRMGSLSEWKACAGPNAARNGVFAARLASEGVTGPSGVFEGTGGLESVVGRIVWPEDGGHFILKTHIKRHPVCYHGQAAVDAALDLHGRIANADVAKVRIEVNRMAFEVMGRESSRWDPQTRETADHSLPYVVAISLLLGKISAADFTDDALACPRTRALLPKIEVAELPAFTYGDANTSPARITITLAAGGDVSAETIYPIGHSNNPISRDDVEKKFSTLWPRERSIGQAKSIVTEVARLQEAASVIPLIDELCR